MPYSTQADILNRMTQQELVQLTDDAGTGVVDAAKVDAAIAAADSLIDAYAGARYALPLASSEQVRTLSVDLAIFELEKRRRRIRDVTQQARDQALAFLRDVAAGRATLEQAATPQAAEASAEKPDRQAQPRVFENDKLDGF